MVSRPMGPAPKTATVSPGWIGGELHGMQGDGERLDNRGQFQREIRRDGDQVGGRQIDELAEEAGKAGVAQKADVGADVVVSGAAVLAVIAVERGFERRAVAGLPAGDAAPALDHGAGGFVAQHHGVFAGGVADGAFRIRMEIAAADTDGTDPDLDFARARVFDRFFS